MIIMKKIYLFLIVLTFFICINFAFAGEVNCTDLESVDEIPLKSTPNSTSEVLESSSSHESDTIKSGDVAKYYKSSTPYKATFTDSEGNALANKNVKISVKNKVYKLKTDNNGKVKLKLNLKPGNYKVIASNPVTGYKLTTNFKVLSNIKSSDLTKVYKNKKQFKAKFLKSNGKALAHKKVKYNLNGKMHAVKTNRNGDIFVSLKKLKKGSYKIKLYHPNGLKKTNKIKVVKSAKTKLVSNDYTFLKSSSKVIKVRLLDQYGYHVSGQLIKASVNGKTYKVKTNGNGIAKIKLKPMNNGVYSIKFKFKHKGYYKSSKLTKKVYVIPSKNPSFTVKSTTTFGKGANTPFKLQLTSGNVPLIKKTVTFKVDNKSYRCISDYEGMVSLPIDLEIGNYTIHYSVNKDSLINSKSSKSDITVKPRINTSITWLSNTSVYQGLRNYQVLLKDFANNTLSGKTVKLTVKSTVYSSITNSSGIAVFDAITPAGIYNVSFSFSGDNDYEDISNNTQINATYKVINGYGYWLKREQFESVTFDNLRHLAETGVTDIFLNSDSVAAFGKDRIESWIANVTDMGMRVHFWFTVFYSKDVWTKAISNGKINYEYFSKKINELRQLCQIKGVAGINLDYIRFNYNAYKIPGSTNAINKFVKMATAAIRDVNEELIISSDIIAKFDKGQYFYGQDYAFISKYMDVIMPMVYKGNAGKSTSWVTSTTKWYVERSNGAIVWAGLQTYKSDSNLALLSMKELTGDAKAAINGGASGLVLFRWGLTNFIDFDGLK